MQVVAFSGGVDSTSLALICEDAIPIFTDTKWEFSETYNHIAKFEEITGREVLKIVHPKYPGGLPQYIRESKFLPNHGARFCTRIFKIEAMNLFFKDRLPVEMLIALRADEEERKGNTTELEGLTIRYPLREMGWTRKHCVAKCLEHDLLPRNPVYMARGGCKGCFYKRKSEVNAMIELVPGEVDELQELEESVQDERGSYFHMFPNVGKSIRELRAQQRMFSLPELYRDAGDNSDIGDNCGLFCHR